MDSREQFDQIITHYIELKDHLASLNVNLAEIKVDVRNHIRRTENIEERQDGMDKELTRIDRQISKWLGALALSGWIFSTAILLVIKFYG